MILQERYNSFIDLQDKLHQNICRFVEMLYSVLYRCQELQIGIYDTFVLHSLDHLVFVETLFT